jgi:hypothetical protein
MDEMAESPVGASVRDYGSDPNHVGRRNHLWRAAIAAAATVAALPATAYAHDEALQRVRPEVGPPLLTHGLDTRAEMASSAAPRAASGAIGFGPGSAERAPVCADGYAERVIYARPSGSKSHYRSSLGEIRSAVRRMDAVLNAESIDSGGASADYRVVCNRSGAISVARMTSSGSSLAAIASAARSSGYGSTAVDYLIFFEGTNGSACGTASLLDDQRPVLTNASNSGGGYAIVYDGCWENETPMHEVGHTMGAVQYGAPHSTGTGGHCFQENDVMCYSPDGGNLNQSGPSLDCPGRERFDCGFDDYFDAAPESGEYLATHWNLGSPLNRFLAFGAAAPTSPLTGGPTGSLLPAGRSSADSREVAGAPGEWRYFDLRLTGLSEALTVRIEDAPAGIDLYLRSRKQPTELSSACRSSVKRGDAVCRVPRPRGWLWVAGVLNRGGAGGAPFEISARVRRGG